MFPHSTKLINRNEKVSNYTLEGSVTLSKIWLKFLKVSLGNPLFILMTRHFRFHEFDYMMTSLPVLLLISRTFYDLCKKKNLQVWWSGFRYIIEFLSGI